MTDPGRPLAGDRKFVKLLRLMLSDYLKQTSRSREQQLELPEVHGQKMVLAGRY
jgi:hypothetical protein